MELTDFLAVWGAVTATVAVGWNLVRDLKDSGKLRVDAMVGRMHPDPTKQDYFTVTVTNVGRRPVLLTGLMTLRKQPWYRGFWKRRLVKYRQVAPYSVLMLKQGSRMLKEGEYHTEVYEEYSLVDERLAGLVAFDSGGREWRMGRKALRLLLDGAKRARDAEGKR